MNATIETQKLRYPYPQAREIFCAALHYTEILALRRASSPTLTFLRAPTIGFGARAAHQHLSLTIGQALSLEEGLDRLLVIDDGVCPGPVRTPEAALETPGLEYAGERIPDVRERIWFLGQRACAAHLDHRVLALGKVQHLRQIGPRLRRGR
jgi:hypothetical protein